MNQEPLEEMVRRAVDRARTGSSGAASADQIMDQVLADPDLTLLLKGIEAHDRSGDLEDVYHRDIRRMIERYLREDGGSD
ncbi:MAG: hypothetical protein JOZ41_22305 [Chloroflexi bacterium]|nr:hypothetical protein [Chloroflexota bacterium]